MLQPSIANGIKTIVCAETPCITQGFSVLSSHLFTPSNDKRFFHDKKGIISQGHSAAKFLCNKLHDEGFMLDRCVKKLEKKA